MAKINENVITQVCKDVEELMRMHQGDLDEAFLKTEDEEALSVALGVKIKPDKGALKITTSISFVTERIKASMSSRVDDNLGLPFPNEDHTGSKDQ